MFEDFIEKLETKYHIKRDKQNIAKDLEELEKVITEVRKEDKSR